jgi:hypothetical protein
MRPVSALVYVEYDLINCKACAIAVIDGTIMDVLASSLQTPAFMSFLNVLLARVEGECLSSSIRILASYICCYI